jgi:hypothetical protein
MGSLPYQSDYVLRLVEQLEGLLRQTMQKLGMGTVEEQCGPAGDAIGLVLGMDPAFASRLSPQSLASLLALGNLDDRIIDLVAQAIELDADVLQARGDLTGAASRREQAVAVRSLSADGDGSSGPARERWLPGEDSNLD